VYLIAQRGHELATQGCYDLAAILFEGLIAVAPSHDWARRALASVQIQTGRPVLALATLKPLPASDAATQMLRLEAHLATGMGAAAAAELAAIRPKLRPPEIRRYSILVDATNRTSPR
jgi:thioredoxin-like negative regulator of GroEL